MTPTPPKERGMIFDAEAVRAGDAQRLAARCRTLADRLIGPIRAAARECGYAVAIHGSLARDIDLIACPWTPDALPADRLVARLIDAIAAANDGLAFLKSDEAFPREKPHGRKAWVILVGLTYIDLSVMTSPDAATIAVIEKGTVSHA